MASFSNEDLFEDEVVHSDEEVNKDGEANNELPTDLGKVAALVTILREGNNKAVLQKARSPMADAAKKAAMEQIILMYARSKVKKTASEVRKMISNLDARIKKKTDLTQTGNKPCTPLLQHEQLFLELQGEKNPKYSKVPGGTTKGFGSCPYVRSRDSSPSDCGEASTSTSSPADSVAYKRPSSAMTEHEKSKLAFKRERHQLKMEKLQLEIAALKKSCTTHPLLN